MLTGLLKVLNAANEIAENLYEQVNVSGNVYVVIAGIIDLMER